MTMTLPTPSKTTQDHTEDASIERIKEKAWIRRLRTIRSLAERVQVAPDGSRTFIRFDRSQCLQHQVLTVSFGVLAMTGLLQTFNRFSLVEWIIQILGGVDVLRTIHHLAATALAFLSFYHVWQILVTWIAPVV